VTEFEIDDDFARSYPVQTAGAGTHRELWIPARELPSFNAHIRGQIRVVAEYAEPRFTASGTTR
jgi:hypothetical protein